MNINNIQNYNQNFNGYKNILAGSIKGSKPKDTLSFMAMQLDGKDLELWKTIQKNLLKIKEPENVITFDVFQKGDYQDMCIGDYNLDLNMLEKSTPKEMLAMQAMTLIASLTKRIANENNIVNDYNIKDSARFAYNRLHTIFNNDSRLVLPFLSETLPNNSQPQIHAKRINDFIKDYMKDYF